MLIGIVGKSGAGKSSFVEKLKLFDNAIIHIDIDKIGHNILKDENVVKKIVEIVGDTSVVVNGVIDRKKVGNIIFNDMDKYKQYYNYTENIENSIIDKIINDNKDKKVFLDWIILDQTKYWGILDYKILVDTKYDIRKNRVVSRDKISEEYFDLRERMKEDYDRDEMDFIIDGNNINEELMREILGELK
jgi:dephospho-CoA kinase